MGYQESYLTASTEKRFQKIVNRIKEVGYDYYDLYGTYPVEIITFNRNHNWFNKGQKAVYFIGERYLQDQIYRLLGSANLDNITVEMCEDNPYLEYDIWKELGKYDKYHAKVFFTEQVLPEGIWKDAGEPLYVTHEQFDWNCTNVGSQN